jgi:hypothetical protein
MLNNIMYFYVLALFIRHENFEFLKVLATLLLLIHHSASTYFYICICICTDVPNMYYTTIYTRQYYVLEVKSMDVCIELRISKYVSSIVLV